MTHSHPLLHTLKLWTETSLQRAGSLPTQSQCIHLHGSMLTDRQKLAWLISQQRQAFCSWSMLTYHGIDPHWNLKELAQTNSEVLVIHIIPRKNMQKRVKRSFNRIALSQFFQRHNLPTQLIRNRRTEEEWGSTLRPVSLAASRHV
jgi:hypothetical protein